jgi:hypothetical protein
MHTAVFGTQLYFSLPVHVPEYLPSTYRVPTEYLRLLYLFFKLQFFVT